MNIVRLIAPLAIIASLFLVHVRRLGALEIVFEIIPIVAIMELIRNLVTFFLEFGLVLVPLASLFFFFFDLLDLLFGHTFIFFVLNFLLLCGHTEISTLE